MRLYWKRGDLSAGRGRALRRELLECAGPEPADRNLRDIARITRWFGGHPAYRFLPMTRRIFGWSPLTLHDGPVSVASAFRLEQLVSLARAAGANTVAGRKRRPWFRVSVVVPAGPAEVTVQETSSVFQAHRELSSSSGK